MEKTDQYGTLLSMQSTATKIIIFLIDGKWQDLLEFTNSFDKISPNEISGRQLVKERDEGNYGCEVSNGISPSLWSEFSIRISGKLSHF